MLSFPTTDFDFFLLLPQRGVGSHELAWERTGKSVCIGEKIDKICEPSELCMFMIDMGAIRQSRDGNVVALSYPVLPMKLPSTLR